MHCVRKINARDLDRSLFSCIDLLGWLPIKRKRHHPPGPGTVFVGRGAVTGGKPVDIKRSQSVLYRFFSGLAEYTFEARLGVADPPLVDYIALLLTRFVHCDTIY